jgi:protein-L-isoaspartate(D-aspartate) O-methyltransferase
MDTETARFNMIEQQIRPWNVLDPRVLSALHEIHREDYVPPAYRELAFADMHIPLDHGQVMMQPKQEARLLQELSLKPGDRVLEIGTGSGHVTALLAHLAGHVDTVDIFPDFIESARNRLSASGLANITFHQGDGARGWDTDKTYDAIFLAGSVAELSAQYRDLLVDGGRLVAIVGRDPVMEAILVERLTDGQCRTTSLFDTSLPPLIHGGAEPSFVF